MTAKSTPLLLRNARSLTQFDWKLAEDYSPPALIVPILLLAENTFPGRGGGADTVRRCPCTVNAEFVILATLMLVTLCVPFRQGVEKLKRSSVCRAWLAEHRSDMLSSVQGPTIARHKKTALSRADV